MAHECSREKGPASILFVVLNLMTGLSCALPTYLYARETAQASYALSGKDKKSSAFPPRYFAFSTELIYVQCSSTDWTNW